MHRLLITYLLIVAMVTQSMIQMASAGGCIGLDGKPSDCQCHPVNIQIGGGCPASSDTSNDEATEELLNMTRTILDLFQNQVSITSIPAQRSTAIPPCTREPISVLGNLRDCSEIQASGVNISGVYTIYPDGAVNALDVYCDMETDGGGWTVIQRRQDGSGDFYLGWEDYKYGFGSVSTEHWLGNDNIHRLSTQKTYELRVDLEDFEEETRFASYSNFNISDEASKYRLMIGDYSGNADDSLRAHNGHFFSTPDRDNDSHDTANCGVLYGAWWYADCHASNLNGLYLNGTSSVYAKGVVWRHWRGYYYSLKKTEMKIRPAE